MCPDVLSLVLVAFEEANDVVASERSIFSDNQDYKSFLRVAMNPYVPIFGVQMRMVAEN